jgi:hypothetical protein
MKTGCWCFVRAKSWGSRRSESRQDFRRLQHKTKLYTSSATVKLSFGKALGYTIRGREHGLL